MLGVIVVACCALMISVCGNALLKPYPHDRFVYRQD